MPDFRICTLLSCALMAGTAIAAPSVPGERNPAKTEPVQLVWRDPGFPSASITRLRYGEMSAERILGLQKANAERVDKPLQIGIGRIASRESTARALPSLRWIVRGDGSAVARIEFLSPLAYGVRAGLNVSDLPAMAELRFSGSAQPDRIIASVPAGRAQTLLGDDGLFWTPATDGEKQFVEIWVPPGTAYQAVRLQAPRLVHLMTNAIDDFKILKDIGDSGSCNINAVCRVGQLGEAYAQTRAAVAKMVFVKEGSSYLCTGTLLNDNDPSTYIPYFHTAHHCISTQQVASTLQTYWNFEATTCGGSVAGNYTTLSGGAAYLYSSANTDGALLRLNDDSPGGAWFSGWNAAPVPVSTSVTAIHHPRGDLKKVSFGQRTNTTNSNANYRNQVGWLEGTTEGGSSGSGLFVLQSGTYAGQYHLQGGLYGGNASCSNSGNLSNDNNYDLYSRFDVDYPNIRQYLFNEPRRRNGSQPLAPPR